MSFDVNPLNNTPQLRATQTQDGGAGNTGYFEQQKKKKEEDELKKSLFKEEKKDTFTLEDAKEAAYIEPPFLLKVVAYFKNLLRRLLYQ
ncbi:hypothetical protein IJ843_02145 [bacterium]|nr:hypothetical protein [bacterium]